MQVNVVTIITSSLSIETLIKSMGLDREAILELLKIEETDETKEKSLDDIISVLSYSQVEELIIALGFEIHLVRKD